MNTINHGSARATAPAAAPQAAIMVGEADCDKVATVLDRLDAGDASPEELDYLIDHAQDCSPCFSSIDKQRLFIAFLQGNIHQKGVPTTLATAIRDCIAQEEPVQ